jgi:hypothetical protein
VAHDFPAQWPELLPALRAMLTSAEIRDVHAGCVGVLEAVRAFRFVSIHSTVEEKSLILIG